jgi:TM2 domain-containing membrane protein YozV
MTMLLTDPIYTANMNDHQRAWFYAEYERARKEEVVGVLLALFLGGFGVHHFYLRRNDLGIIYILLSWTGIPTVLGWVECFFMPDRVRSYNAAQAMYIANQIHASTPPADAPAPIATHCASCGIALDPTAAFCRQCGASTTTTALSTQPAV